MNTASHKWHFFRSGGFDQVRLETGEDIQVLAELDPKLWAALSCPVTNLEFGQRASDSLNPVLAAYEALAGQNLSPASEQLIGLPLAKIAAGQPLSLADGINPAWLQAATEFRNQVVIPLVGVRDVLTSEE